MKFYWFFAFCIFIGIICLALGFWQIERLGQKQALLQQLKTEKISVAGTFTDNEKERFILSARSRSQIIEHRIVRILHTQGKAILVDIGWVNKDTPFIAEKAEITGTQISPTEKNYFTPENNLSKNQWYYINIKEMAETSQIKLESFYISTDANLWQKIPNNHTQYAITWFCLAIIFLLTPFFTRTYFA